VRYLAELLLQEQLPPQEIVAELANRFPNTTPLERWRLARGYLTREAFVDRLIRIGRPVGLSTVQRAERGRHYSQATLEAFCAGLQVDAGQLLGDPRPTAVATAEDANGWDMTREAPTASPAPPRGWPSLFDTPAWQPGDLMHLPPQRGLNAVAPHELSAMATIDGLDGDVLAMYAALLSGSSPGELDGLEASVDYAAQHWDTVETGTATLPWWRAQYRRLGRALSQPQPSGTRRRLSRLAAQVGGQLGQLAWSQGNPQLANLLVQVALVAADDVGDQALVAWLRAGPATDVAARHAWGHADVLDGQGVERAGQQSMPPG
jgi:hypothetical protein